MNRPLTPAAASIADRVLNPLKHFLHIEAASGIVLLGAAVLALLWANSPWAGSYEQLWHLPAGFSLGGWAVSRPLHFWIDEGLMTVFFLVAGLEIRREIHDGALADRRRAALPLAAALGGVVTPALIYLLLVHDPALRQGWAVPTATDIAFAVGVLALLGPRVPVELRVLLLALAVIDDIAAIVIIALYYTGGVGAGGLLLAGGGLGLVLLFQHLGVPAAPAYVLPGAVVWLGLLAAGVHPTLAGVLLGLMTPAVPLGGSEGLLRRATAAIEELGARLRRGERDPEELLRPAREVRRSQRDAVAPAARVQDALHPWVAFGVMPLFALANAGVDVGALAQQSGAVGPLLPGIVLALVLGKPLGIVLATAACVRLRLCELPAGVNLRGVALVGCIAGIGFTMSMFVAHLAFADPAALAAAKLAVLMASALAALIGLSLGRAMLRAWPLPPRRHSP